MERVLARVFAALALLPCQASDSLAGPLCDVCDGGFGHYIVYFQDKVDGSRKALCEACGALPTVCCKCGVPTAGGYVALSDGRVICGRDAKGVVLDETTALEICRQTFGSLSDVFGRFITFPEENVRLQMMDRIDVQALYRIPGHDFTCPNVMGCVLSSTNQEGVVRHDIRILTGQSSGDLRAVTAHEYAHAWMGEHVSVGRLSQMDPNAVEGFCELIAYMVSASHGDHKAMEEVLSNAYTRGQVQLFIQAEREYGFNDVVDWIRFGTADRLSLGNVAAIRDVVMPRKSKSTVTKNILYIPAVEPAAPEALELKGIMQSSRMPLAMINNLTLAVGESGQARVRDTRVEIRCIEIGRTSVLIEKTAEGETLTLELSPESR